MKNITSESVYHNRRMFLRQAICLGLLAGPATSSFSKSLYDSGAKEITPEKYATGYNNYYEFSTNKEAVATLAQALTMKPWSLSVTGLVENPLNLDIQELEPTVERIYNFRCVEGWSMVVPWTGVPLAYVLRQAKPLSNARFVKFEALFRPEEMLGQRRQTMPWPYLEGLRLDEAMHDLTLLATGMYRKSMPPQNGGPLRLVVPWKYGFKSIKAITKIELVEHKPVSTWQQLAPSEYGFYANVNPDAPHPRWSQRREVRLGEIKKRPTLAFNGYEQEVADLYHNMDLQEHY